MGNEHISFEVRSESAMLRRCTDALQTAKIGSLVDVNDSEDPEGLRVFYYLVQDLKALVFSLIALHFKVSIHGLKLDCFTDILCRSSQSEAISSRE